MMWSEETEEKEVYIVKLKREVIATWQRVYNHGKEFQYCSKYKK